MLDSAPCRGYTDDITGRRKNYAPHREKAAQLQRHKAHCHRRDDRRPHRVGGVSGVSEGVSPPAHASHRAHHLPDYVLLHRRGVSLHAEHPQVYRASLCFRADLAFLLHIFLARFHRLALFYPVLLRRRAQPDERYKDEVPSSNLGNSSKKACNPKDYRLFYIFRTSSMQQSIKHARTVFWVFQPRGSHAVPLTSSPTYRSCTSGIL